MCFICANPYEMKKYLCLFVMAVLASCSSDDSTETNSVLLKKIIETFDGGDIHTTTYHYNGNKLAYALNEEDESKIVYTYSGNQISEVSYQNLTGAEYVRYEFTYDSAHRLKHSVTSGGAPMDSYIDYTYNSDGTVTANAQTWDMGEMEYINETVKIYISNGDIVKREIELLGGEITANYLYDTKPNPYRNVTGFDKLLDFYMSAHNNISAVSTGSDGTVLQQTNTSYVYTAENYPETSVETNDSGSVKTVSYFYE